MKKIIASLLLLCLSSNIALADCDWSKIKSNTDGTYTYSKELHVCVGQLVQQNSTLSLQVADLTKAIELKDLAITKSDQRVQLWIDTNDKLSDRLSKVDEIYKHNEFLYFGLGVLATVGAGFMIARLVR